MVRRREGAPAQGEPRRGARLLRVGHARRRAGLRDRRHAAAVRRRDGGQQLLLEGGDRHRRRRHADQRQRQPADGARQRGAAGRRSRATSSPGASRGRCASRSRRPARACPTSPPARCPTAPTSRAIRSARATGCAATRCGSRTASTSSPRTSSTSCSPRFRAPTASSSRARAGISLFIVPKKLVDAQGQLTGERNDVALAGLNHKLGYRGIPNTLLNFGEGKYPARRALARRDRLPRRPSPARACAACST